MDITLSFIRLNNEQIGHMAPDLILITGRIATKDLLQPVVKVST